MRTFSPIQRNIAVSLLALAAAVLAGSSLVGILLDKTPLTRLDRRAEAYVESTMARAAATFAVVRGLNGMVSVIQGTQIAVSPAGVGLNLSVGEVLDPINDLAERFSWVMLVSTASLGLQRLLMEMGDWLGLQILLAAALTLAAAAVWKRCWGRLDLRSTAVRLFVLAMAVRFFIPAVAVFSETIYERFLTSHYQEATRSLTRLSDELKAADPTVRKDPAPSPSESPFQDWRRWMAETRELFDLRAKIDLLGGKLERLTEDTIRLMVVFVLQTVLIPLATLWVLIKVVAMGSVAALPRSS